MSNCLISVIRFSAIFSRCDILSAIFTVARGTVLRKLGLKIKLIWEKY